MYGAWGHSTTIFFFFLIFLQKEFLGPFGFAASTKNTDTKNLLDKNFNEQMHQTDFFSSS